MWEKTPWWTYSLSDESSFMPFQYISKEDALKAAMEDAEIEGAERIYVGRMNEYRPSVDAEQVIDQIKNDAEVEKADADTEWPLNYMDNVSLKDLYELEDMLTEAYRKWEDKHPEYKAEFYTIADIEEFQLGEEGRHR